MATANEHMDHSNFAGANNYRQLLLKTEQRLHHIAVRKAYLKEKIASIKQTLQASFSRITKTQDAIEEMREKLPKQV